ncbi:MAG: PHP domain-containing protein [Acidimicrobiales bacterium]
MDPASALREVAFSLEAAGAPTYKVRAFRFAAATAAAIGDEELGRLHEAGRLQDLEGIGKATAAVISDALAGLSPAYLDQLREAHELTPRSKASRDLLASIRGDCHSHSDWSDGGSPPLEMAEAAIKLGRQYQALTDHSPRLKIANGLTRGRLERQLELVASLNLRLAPFKVLTGIEVDILEDGGLDQDADLLAELDVVVASVHSKLSMEPAKMTARMIAAVQDPNVDVLGHCTGRIIQGRGRSQSRFDPDAVFSACARSATAVEINSRPERSDPPMGLLRLAKSLGCRFAIDSDAHAPGQLTWLVHGCDRAAEAGVVASEVVNTLDAQGLLAWTAPGRGE